MMTGFVWVNFPLCALIFGAIAGIPLWLVLTRSEWGPGHHSPDEWVSPAVVLASPLDMPGDELDTLEASVHPALADRRG
jgi:hypothetical protein